VAFCPVAFCPLAFCPVAFCPWHFVRGVLSAWHFIRIPCVCVCVCVCPRDKLKTIAYICFCFALPVSRRLEKISEKFSCQGHGHRSRSFFKGFKKYTTSY